MNTENKSYKIVENLLLLSLCLCAFFICINEKIPGFFQLAATVLFVISCFQKPKEIKERFHKYRWLLFIYLIYCFFEFLPVLNSSDIKLGLKLWMRTYLLRGTLLFIVLFSFSNWKQYTLILACLVGSFLSDTLFALVLTPPPQYGGRLNGFFGHPMIYAGFSCVVLPLLFYLSINVSRLSKKIIYSLITLLCLATLLLNGTRGAWAACIFSFGIIFLFSRPNIKNILLILGIVLSVGVVFLGSKPEIVSRMNSFVNLNQHLESERIYIWKSSWDMFKKHPLIGVGLGNYANEYKTNFISPKARERDLTRAHSNIFQLLGEGGLCGLLGYLILTLFIFVFIYREFKQTKDPSYLICLASVSALFIQGLTEYNLAHSSVMKFYWLWLGSLISLGSLGFSKKNEIRNFM